MPEEDIGTLKSALAKAQNEANKRRDELTEAMDNNEELQAKIHEMDVEIRKLRKQKVDAAILETAPSSGSTGETAGVDAEAAHRLNQLQQKLADAHLALETARDERDVLAHGREELSHKCASSVAALQAQLMQLQKHCLLLHEASDELQHQLACVQVENEQYRSRLKELSEIMESDRQAAEDSSWSLGLCGGDRKGMRGGGLADELGLEGANSDEEVAPPPAVNARIQELHREYQKTFEKQKKQLEEATKKKEALEREKDRAVERLQTEIMELQKKLPNESGSLGGLFDMMENIKNLTLQASDAMIISIAGQQDDMPKIKPKQVDAFSKVEASSARDRLAARKAKKAGVS